MTSWIYLFVAIAFELAGSSCLKLSNGFTNIIPSVLMITFYFCSMYGLSMALKGGIELGIAYAVWSGLGTALITILGIMLFNESICVLKIASIFLVLTGIIGLNLASKFGCT